MLQIVVVAGLLVALAALMDTGRGVADALPAMRVTFTVPQGLLVASAVVLALAWLLFMVAARRSRKLEEEPPEARLRWPWWRQALAQIALLLPLIALVVLLWLDGGRIAGVLLAFGRAWFGTAGAAQDGAVEQPVISLPWVGWSVGLTALAAALLTLAIALLVLMSDRLVAWWLARDASARTEELVEAIDDSLDDLADDADARAAITRCYRRFEQVAARARVRRAPWQTADEFMHDLLGRLALPELAVERLTRLFEIARFSHHAVTGAERDLARACLEEIRTVLERRSDAVVVA